MFDGDDAKYVALGILGLSLLCFAWGRWRYDIVAVSALVASVSLGLVDLEAAFLGFAHPAVITVAAVFVISYAIRSSDLLTDLSSVLGARLRDPVAHVLWLTATVAVLSSVMNNIAALSLMLPIALASAAHQRRSPSLLLMPLAFGSLLGGMTTLIGTPPNLIVSSYRETLTGEPFALLDYAPVGVAICILGVLFVGIVGWRLLPSRVDATSNSPNLGVRYLANATLTPQTAFTGSTLKALREKTTDVLVLGLIEASGKFTSRGQAVFDHTQQLSLLGQQTALNEFATRNNIRLAPQTASATERSEVLVMPGSTLIGQRVGAVQEMFGENLRVLGLSREGLGRPRALAGITVRLGDVLWVQDNRTDQTTTLATFGLQPLNRKRVPHSTRRLGWLMCALFAAGLTISGIGLVSLPVALFGVIVAMIVTGCLRTADIYRGVDWSIVVLLGAFIPVGEALASTGATELLATSLVGLGHDWPIWSVLLVILVVTMTLTEILNNATTALVMAPVAAGVAHALGLNPDPFLIIVAIGASCAFMTPIGHQSNVLVMGPGGYHFGDYWRMGLPLQVLIAIIAVPLTLWVWPVGAN